MLAALSRSVNHPSITISAVFLGVWLGVMQFPFVKHLQPVGDFYVSLLQMFVLPFLLATIPLAVHSALTSGTGGEVVVRLAFWLIVTFVVVALVAVLVPTAIFHLMPLDQTISNRIGALFGASAHRVDLEFALNPEFAIETTRARESGLLDIIPSNVFSALASGNTLGAIVFATIFGAAMVMSERRSGAAIFGPLKHIQAVCILIFDLLNLLVPIGIVALIAPQVAFLGPDIYAILAPFAYAFLATSAVLLLMPIVVVSVWLRRDPRLVFAKMLRPLALAVATRNALVCAPAALETMKKELRARPEACDLFIPIGFAIVRFGPMIHFTTATLFIGYLLGLPFGMLDLVFVAAMSIVASFATIGISGIALLAPLAAVLRPFGLSYELALPLMVIVDPVVAMIRAMFNVGLNMQVPVLAAGREPQAAAINEVDISISSAQ
jgi:Na+/H+-dicarboxylate symporter